MPILAIENNLTPHATNRQDIHDNEAAPEIEPLAEEVETTGKPGDRPQGRDTILEELVSQRWFEMAAGFPRAV